MSPQSYEFPNFTDEQIASAAYTVYDSGQTVTPKAVLFVLSGSEYKVYRKLSQKNMRYSMHIVDVLKYKFGWTSKSLNKGKCSVKQYFPPAKQEAL